ncbi:MAG: glycosyltransferase family 2 protein [Bdellovibrionales bacterium]|nr:glycosyltransferase family 2 protein [Bdellovibrionales bacterium]
MYREKKVSLVIPAYNEEKLLEPTLRNVPSLFDRIIVVDDKSPDNQAQVVERLAQDDPRIILIRHEVNKGPGGGIISGYQKTIELGIDIAVVIGGDHQMDLSEVERFLDPLVDGLYDYTKGNRFFSTQWQDTLEKMPKVRLIGNWIITLLTKVASGYYKVMDVVDGYTAINSRALRAINWNKAWERYGYPMDFLIRLNAYGMRVGDVPRTAIYTKGERQSQIKGIQYALRVSPMLLRGFLWRLNFKYLFYDFHPVVFFFYFSFLFLPLGLLFGGYLVFDWMFWGGNAVTGPRAVLDLMVILAGLQFLMFAILFDSDLGHCHQVEERHSK